MAVTITRTYEETPQGGNLGANELSFAGLNGVENLWIGLITDADALNNLAVDTRVTVTEGSNEVVVSLGARSFVNSLVVLYTYTIVSGSINFSGGASVNATVGTGAPEISLSGVNLGPGDETIATIAFPDTATGLTAAEVTVSVGTKGAITQNGDSYTLPITLPTGVTGLNRLTVSIDADVVDEGNAAAEASLNFGTVENRIFAFDTNSNIFHAFAFSATGTVSTEDQNSEFGSIIAAYATDRRIYAYDGVSHIRVWDLFWNRLPDEDRQPNTPTDRYRGMTGNDTDLILVNDTDDQLEFYDHSDLSLTYDSNKDVSLSSANWGAATRLGANIYIGNNTIDAVEIRNLTGDTVSGTFSASGNLILQALFATVDRVYILNRNTGASAAFDASGSPQVADNLALGSGRWLAAFAVFEPPTPAEPVVATISIADTKIGGGRSTKATLSTDIDVDNLVIGDLSVNVGELSNFTRVTAREFTVDITAPDDGTSGTITLTLAENSIGSGNDETTATVDYAPLAVPTIAFNVPKAISQGVIRATVSFPKGANGLAIGDVSVDVGHLSNFQGVAGDTRFSVDITAPAGIGTLTLSLAKDAVDELNDALDAEIDYEPFVASWQNVPTGTTNVQFSAELHVSHAISGLTGSDIRMVRNAGADSLGSHNLTNAQVTITPIAGTNNYALALDLTRTYDGIYALQLRSDQVAAGLEVLPAAALNSNAFHMDSDHIDGDPPDAPTHVEITTTPTGAMISWRAGDDGGQAVSDHEYRIQEGATIDAAVEWESTGSTDTSIELSSLKKGTEYAFEVRQVNVIGEGESSGVTTFTTDATIPGEPFLVSATAISATVIKIVLEFSEDTGGATLTDIEIRYVEGSGTYTQWTPIGLLTAYQLTQLRPSTRYMIQVRSRNSEGPSPESNAITVQTDRLVRQVPRFTTAPMDVKVELTPRTALITWKAPTNGASIRVYEISYAEGASPGTTWIPTESLSTRFFVKGLKRGTQYTWQVRGVTDNGAGDASRPVTERTPIASLHNALFFKECVNYFDDGARVSEHGNPSNIIRAVGDNNYKTFTREKDMVLNIAVGGQPTRVDAIFVKGIDIEGHSAEPTGGTGVGYNNRGMPSTMKNWEGTEVSTVVAGFQHDLYLLDSHFTATSVRMTFTGTDAKITEIMLLEFGLEIDSNADFTQINPDFVDRTGVVHPDAGDGIAYSPSIGDGRDKWQVDYVVRVVPGKTLLETPEDFLYWRSENRNHVHAQEFTRYPWRVFPAVFLGKSVPVRYRTNDKTGGEILNFRVAEQ